MSSDKPAAKVPSTLQSITPKKNTSFASKNTTDKPKSKSHDRTTLASLLKYMEGYEVIVELKTGKRHQGVLLQADDNTMNVVLKIGETVGKSDSAKKLKQQEDDSIIYQATEQDPSHLSIRGSQIRYIQFPDNANVSSIVLSGREREQAARNKYRKTLRKAV